ncbi:MAG: substrate-binding domain-containing protein [Candidatus Marinimicrobia bacterium]|nr:substrate-binding domain-containing protein [Candidatus Neomarinimicrobiota bacterium]MCF7922580.1 substrate-binding domain-containing protein [Candidatus Neomarinimicrobiota bacterium]
MKNMKRSKLSKAILVRILPALLLSFLILPFLICCDSKSSDDEINLYCCTAMKDVVVEGIIPAFQEMQLAQNNRDVNFVTNFAGSVELTCTIASERTADVAILASEIDAMGLLNRGIINEQTWRKSPHQGTIAQTPILILYNSEETSEITDFQDLAQASVKLIHPCPLYSGLGQWALMASYGSFLFETANDTIAMDKLKKLWHSVTLKPASALMARDLYTKGRGNAIITYESEILGSSNREVMPGQVSVPANTIICELKVVKIPQERSLVKEKLVEEFNKFLWSDRAQQIFVDYGFRSVADRLNGNNPKFFELGSTFTLDSLGGIPFVKWELIETKWQNEIRKYFKKSVSSEPDVKC